MAYLMNTVSAADRAYQQAGYNIPVSNPFHIPSWRYAPGSLVPITFLF